MAGQSSATRSTPNDGSIIKRQVTARDQQRQLQMVRPDVVDYSRYDPPNYPVLGSFASIVTDLPAEHRRQTFPNALLAYLRSGSVDPLLHNSLSMDSLPAVDQEQQGATMQVDGVQAFSETEPAPDAIALEEGEMQEDIDLYGDEDDASPNVVAGSVSYSVAELMGDTDAVMHGGT